MRLTIVNVSDDVVSFAGVPALKSGETCTVDIADEIYYGESVEGESTAVKMWQSISSLRSAGKITVFASQSANIEPGATANPKQSAIANLSTVSSISGTESVDSSAVLNSINNLVSKVNTILSALRNANIISTS